MMKHTTPPKPKKYYNLTQAARRIGISKQLAHQWAQTGRLTRHAIATGVDDQPVWGYDQEEVHDLARQREQQKDEPGKISH